MLKQRITHVECTAPQSIRSTIINQTSYKWPNINSGYNHRYSLNTYHILNVKHQSKHPPINLSFSLSFFKSLRLVRYLHWVPDMTRNVSVCPWLCSVFLLTILFYSTNMSHTIGGPETSTDIKRQLWLELCEHAAEGVRTCRPREAALQRCLVTFLDRHTLLIYQSNDELTIASALCIV